MKAIVGNHERYIRNSLRGENIIHGGRDFHQHSNVGGAGGGVGRKTSFVFVSDISNTFCNS
jgi:hypothetical protein